MKTLARRAPLARENDGTSSPRRVDDLSADADPREDGVELGLEGLDTEGHGAQGGPVSGHSQLDPLREVGGRYGVAVLSPQLLHPERGLLDEAAVKRLLGGQESGGHRVLRHGDRWSVRLRAGAGFVLGGLSAS